MTHALDLAVTATGAVLMSAQHLRRPIRRRTRKPDPPHDTTPIRLRHCDYEWPVVPERWDLHEAIHRCAKRDGHRGPHKCYCGVEVLEHDHAASCH